MNLQLEGRVMAVMGGSAGIGHATALALAAEGATLVVGARDPERLDETVEEIRALGADVIGVSGDLTTSTATERLAQEAERAFGAIHGLVCCVGSTPLGSFDELDDGVWQQAFDMKFMATVRAIRAVLPTMRQQRDGRVVVLGGNIAQEPTPWMMTSGAINSALGNLVSSLGRTYGSEGVGVNCVNTGPVRTARYEGMRAAVMTRMGLDDDEAVSHIDAMIPDGRVAEPHEVADQVAYLLSPRASHVNGSTVVLDGAQTWAR